MSTEQLISIEVYCQHEGLEITFVHALHERGLIDVVSEQERSYIAPAHLSRLEQLARMHYELDIDLEGIEAISHLLERLERMQQDLRAARERLRLYEDDAEGR